MKVTPSHYMFPKMSSVLSQTVTLIARKCVKVVRFGFFFVGGRLGVCAYCFGQYFSIILQREGETQKIRKVAVYSATATVFPHHC